MKSIKVLIGAIIMLSPWALRQEVLAQDPPIENPRLVPMPWLKSEVHQVPYDFHPVQKRPGHYSATDWRQWIDTVWGAGLPTSDKLAVFDAYWSIADQLYGGFPNLSLDWNAVRNRYRDEVASGVSRGRFYAIMSQLWRSLQEIHTWVRDKGVDESCYYPPKHIYWAFPGIPLMSYLNVGITAAGMGLAPMPDSSLLVYRVQPGHPLGIEAGDILLGYDRMPWKEILRELDSAQVPVASYFSLWGSHTDGFEHARITSAAANWTLFDTMDVVRYATGDTVHLSTKPLADIEPGWDTLYCTDQLPVPGVPMPNPMHGSMCTWGIVEGTSIGYIYAYDWSTPGLDSQFTQAVREMMTTTTGLILDFRLNFGGSMSYADGGFAYLFNRNNATQYNMAHRSNPLDHMGFTQTFPPSWAGGAFNATPDIYDHPIAVLTGPSCLSAGDYNVFRMRFHPMVRIFGKRSNTGYVDGNYSSGTIVNSNWAHRVSEGSGYSLYNGEGYLIHKGFDVDEAVWQTREDAASGVDAVVKRAMEWITAVSYAHDVTAHKDTLKKMTDSLNVTAKVENPLGHTLIVSAIVTTGAGIPTDSVVLLDDGLHGDGLPGDSIWGATIRHPAAFGNYGISVRTDDQTAGGSRFLQEVAQFVVLPNAIARSSPPGLSMTVDGTTFSGDRGFSWSVGTSHTISTYTPQGGGLSRWLFSNWSDGEAMSHTVTASDTTTTYTATFITQRKLTTSVNPGGAGSIVAVPGSPDSYYDAGVSVQLSAVPGTGFTFARWNGDLTGSKNPDTLIMSSPRTVTARFDTIHYPIIATAGAHGTIVPSDTVMIPHGGNKRFEFTADAGYYVDTVVVDGSRVDSASGYTFTDVTTSHTIRVVFASLTQVQWTLRERWNLVSLPVRMQECRKESLFCTAASSAFWYDSAYLRCDTLRTGRGYWLKFVADESKSLIGDYIVAESVDVHQGWNLIGSISSPLPVSMVHGSTEGVMITNFYGYHGGYFTTDTIYPGRGYWVKSNGAGRLILSSAGGMPSKNMVRILETSETPPPPPAGDGQETNPPLADEIPKTLALEQNYPNPFNPATVIQYSLPQDAMISLRVYSMLGQLVLPLVEGERTAGHHAITLDASKLPSGLYFYTLTSTGSTITRKMLLMR